MKYLFIYILAAAVFLFASATSYAAGESSCQIIYGGGQVCQTQIKFTVNKLVQKPGKGGGDFVDNLTLSDPRLTPSQNINFKIIIENTGNTDISNLNVTDVFPKFLTFVAGVGNTNVGASQISFIVGTLKAGQKMEFLITAKTADAGALPTDRAITCVTNNVKAVSLDGQQAEDNSQVCIENNILGQVSAPEILQKPTVTQIPATGPEMGLLFGLAGAGALGFYLKKRAN